MKNARIMKGQFLISNARFLATTVPLVLAVMGAMAADFEIIRVDPNAPPPKPLKAELATAVYVRDKLNAFEADSLLVIKDPMRFKTRAREIREVVAKAERGLTASSVMRECLLAATSYQSYWSMNPNHFDAKIFGEHFGECKAAIRHY